MKTFFPALALVAALVLAGCGGSGNGNGNHTLKGQLLGVDNAPLSGDSVIYDKGTAGQKSAVTDAQGGYRFVVPRDAITGSDTLTFTDAAGHVIDVVPVTIDINTPSTFLTTVAPPTPPTTQL